MQTGECVAGRFVIERAIGAGGMGTVFRARDRESGEPIAIKTMIERGAPGERERFEREARWLGAVTEDALVRFVAAGEHAGQPFLAMAWIDGESLADRLARAPLDTRETLAVLRRIGAALAALHRAGVVHRDVKPANIVLAARQPSRATLVDLGIARATLGRREAFGALATAAPSLTGTHGIVGTVGYMAPEQARGERNLGPAVDVFALGCVAFECLTGAPAFEGPHPVAVLAKLLLERVEPPSSRVPSITPDIDALVLAMTSPAASERPADGAALLALLDAADAMPGASPRPERARDVITLAERRVIGVVLSEPVPTGEFALASTAVAVASDVSAAEDDAEAARFDARAASLVGGARVYWWEARGAATDRAIVAGRLARALAARFPDRRFALAVGAAETTALHPAGPVVDAAARALQVAPAGAVALDAGSVGLFAPGFEVITRGAVATLGPERAAGSVGRTLLGRPTPTVGREREIGALAATVDACVADGAAAGVLVTGAAGAGKSRLRDEFERRARASMRVISVRGDIAATRAVLGVVRAVVRTASGDARPADATRDVLIAAGAQNAREMAALLAALADPSLVPALPAHFTADPARLGEATHEAFVEWLGALAAREPTAVVVEDAHWSDAVSLRWLHDALARHEDRPWLLALFARPEIIDDVPELSQSTRLARIPLPPIPRRACERLTRLVLGEAVPAALVETLTTRAGGNAFYLEELLRMASRGEVSTLPSGAVAMAQTRLESLDPEERRALRAGSVFGEEFEPKAVATMVGRDVDTLLASLVAREVLEPRPNGAVGFRHALLRSAAHASLTDNDRRLAHGSAADWLRARTGVDPMIIADHLEAAGRAAEAIEPLLEGLRVAAEAIDGASVIRAADRAERLGAAGSKLGEALALRALAEMITSNFVSGVRTAERALPLLEPFSPSWITAATVIVSGAWSGTQSDATVAVLAALIDGDLSRIVPSLGAGVIFATLATSLEAVGQTELVVTVCDRAAEIAAREPRDAAFVAMAELASVFRKLHSGQAAAALASAHAVWRVIGSPGNPQLARKLSAGMRELTRVALADFEGLLADHFETDDSTPGITDNQRASYAADALAAEAFAWTSRHAEALALCERIRSRGENPTTLALVVSAETESLVATGRAAEAKGLLDPFLADIYSLPADTAAIVVGADTRVRLALGDVAEALARIDAFEAEVRGMPINPDARVVLDARRIQCHQRAGVPLAREELAAAAGFVRAIADDLAPSFPEVRRQWLAWECSRVVLDAAAGAGV